MRNRTTPNFAGYGYGDREDMTRFIAEGKKMKFADLPGTPGEEAPVLKSSQEGSVGRWHVTQVIRGEETEKADDGVKKEEESVKKEEDDEAEEDKGGSDNKVDKTGLGENFKRERGRTPDQEDLIKFRVREKRFPGEEKDEFEKQGDVKLSNVGFKRRKVGMKNSRVSTAL